MGRRIDSFKVTNEFSVSVEMLVKNLEHIRGSSKEYECVKREMEGRHVHWDYFWRVLSTLEIMNYYEFFFSIHSVYKEHNYYEIDLLIEKCCSSTRSIARVE